jgi:hypothetical protein
VVYGPSLHLVELLGDRVGLSVSDINDAMIAYIEYQWFNGCHSLDDSEFVQQYFMGDSVGYSVLYAVQAQMVEIGSYVPGPIQSLRYSRTIKDGFYVIGTIDEHATDLRCD